MQMMTKMSVCGLCVIGNKAWQHSNVGEVLVLRKKGGQKSQQAVVSPGRTLRNEGRKPLREIVCFFDQAAVQRHGRIN